MLFDGPNASNSMIDLFNIIILFGGLYCFYAWFQLRGGKIPKRFALLGKGLDPEKCLDQEYYVSYMRPRLLLFAILITVTGTLVMVDSRLGLFAALFGADKAGTVALIVGSFLPFAIVVWFCACLFKVQRELWP